MKIKARLEPGKVALVTGGSSGIGKAIACILAERGMDVWMVAQRMEILESARKEVEGHRKNHSQKIEIASTDVSDIDQAQRVVKQVSENSGPPYLLVNSAGVTHPGYVQDLDIEIFRWMMDVNYFGTLYMTKAVIPAMIKQRAGYIVNISSLAGYLGGFGYTAYGASKFAVRGFSEGLRQEMKPFGIGVSIIYPSDTDTPQLAYENRFKPHETKALANFTGAMTAEKVAEKTMKGIERGQFTVFPALEGKFWVLLNRLSTSLIQFIIDVVVADAVKKKHNTHQREA
jgi:3-dehydrosphinganine reductase